jgi:hypothetical protein
MGLLETSIRVVITEHVAVFAATLIVLSILTLATLKSGTQKPIGSGIYSVEGKGEKIVYHEAVLVGVRDEKTWLWLAELRAKFRYMTEGHNLMFTAFKKVCLPLHITYGRYIDYRTSIQIES